MNNKLHVGNLAFETSEIELEDLFNEVAPTTEVSLMQDRASGQSRGFAFVTMQTQEGATAAITRLNGSEVNGRAMSVTEARPKEERSSGPGGGPRNKFKPRY